MGETFGINSTLGELEKNRKDHCTTIKFVLGGRFKESELFSE